MWHTAEIVKILKKITNGYGYEVYQDKKKCVALCNDLLADYSAEKNIMQMLFQAGLGEAMRDVPFKSKSELKMGLSNIDKFLIAQAIESSVRDEVLDVIKQTFALNGADLEAKSAYQPVISRTFNDIHFKLLLPVIKEFSDRVDASFKFIYKDNQEEIDTVLEKCIITDRFGKEHSSHMDYELLSNGKTKEVTISVPVESRKIYVADAGVEFVFLCSNNKKISVFYHTDSSRKSMLKKVEVCQMTSVEHSRMIDIVNLILKTVDDEQKSEKTTDTDTNNGENEETQTFESYTAYTSSDISEYSDALHKEIFYLKQGKGKKYKIVNGNRLNVSDKGIFTYTMAKIVNKYIAQNKSVLIVSHSNVSVDGVIKQVVKMLDSSLQSYLENGKILRFGYVRDEELSQNPYATSFNYTLSKCETFARQLDILNAKRDELRAKNRMKSEEYTEIEKKIKAVRAEIRREERNYVQSALVIGTTISRATVDPMFDERQFDLVMFDEVSMAYVPQVIAAAALAREKFMCVGDFKQLAPISQNQAARILQVDIFSYLRIVDEKGNMFWHPWLVMLNEQRRMAPAISEFPSKFIYKGLLKDNSVVLTGQNKKKNDVVINKQPLAKDALNLVDMAGTYCAADKNTDGSRFNILSAVISFSTAVNAQNNNIDDVGIITPYAAQVRLIRAMLRDYYAKDIPSIRCATVHQFQGSESDVIVFDAVESYPKGAVGYLMGKEPNQVTRLINVAITRGKGKVIVVANARFWENIFKGRNHVFYRLLQHIKNKNHQVVEYQDKTLQPYVESINPGKVVDIFVDEQDAIAKFEQDMLKAKWKVVISLPSGALRETENQVFKLIDDADSRGVDILMKSNDYASLPQHWKNYCRGTENATFPLIIIDDEVSWYGLPTANWKFDVDKTTSLKTVVYMMVRFKGKNTVEMLKALTDIETVAIGVNTRKLLKKDNNMVTHPMASSSGVVVPDDGKSAYGLAGFVEEKEFCPACKSHMVLTKNARGTAYLKCSNKACKETKYLTVDLMNWYISSHNVGCPKHDGGELKGRLGKYGPYVTCTCGHTLKPHDI